MNPEAARDSSGRLWASLAGMNAEHPVALDTLTFRVDGEPAMETGVNDADAERGGGAFDLAVR